MKRSPHEATATPHGPFRLTAVAGLSSPDGTAAEFPANVEIILIELICDIIQWRIGFV